METNNMHFLIQTFIVIGSIVMSQVMAFFFRKMALKNGKEILEPLTGITKIQDDMLVKLSLIDNSNNQKIYLLFKMIGKRKEHHKKVFLKLYQFHFASVSILLISSVISIIVMFIVAEDGLRNSGPYLNTVFFTIAGITTFYGLSPIVFKQDHTINKNLKNYVFYDNMQDEIYNYVVTNASQLDEFEKFHTQLIRKISENNSIDLDFDFKSIKTPDFFKESR